ncbi:MAG: MBL fold metallo-hydrolase [Promethearchaeota archaeon]|nr:MAG: MBL fold metallo-hydrolase [Candidatus Lokiarchaeota archaeon]
MEIEILNLYSNIAKPGSNLIGKHGQSFLLTIEDEKILFDTGGSGTVLLKNMENLNIDPNDISKLIISHGHDDHTKGLPDFLDARTTDKSLPVYAHHNIREPKFAKALFFKLNIGFPDLTDKQEKKINFRFIKEPTNITQTIRTTGEIKDRKYKDGIEPRAVHKEGGIYKVDPIYDDLSLILNTTEGQVIIAGCAHAGILNICDRTKKTLDKPIKAIIGGTHMVRYSKKEVIETGEILIKQFDNPDLYLNHCTDQLPYKFLKRTKAIDILQRKFGESKIKPCYVGTKITYTVNS